MKREFLHLTFKNSKVKEYNLLSIIITPVIALIAAFLAFRQIKLNHFAAAQLRWFRTIREATIEFLMNADSSHVSLLQINSFTGIEWDRITKKTNI